jgi:hypothetical protein
LQNKLHSAVRAAALKEFESARKERDLKEEVSSEKAAAWVCSVAVCNVGCLQIRPNRVAANHTAVFLFAISRADRKRLSTVRKGTFGD